MHHWTVHSKVEFQKCPWDVRPWELHSTTLDPELRNEFKSFSNLGSLFHNFWSWTDGDKGLWQICMHHWTVHAKVEFQKFLPDVRLGGAHSTTLDPEINIYRFTLISFKGFPAILSALQPFQICIFNKKYSKLTFSNGPQLMRKRFMANLHASLDSTFKSRISKMSMRCQSCRGPFHNFGSWTQKWKIYIDIFYGVSCNVRCNTAISNVHFQ